MRVYSGSGSIPYRPLIHQDGHYFYPILAMGVSSASWTPYAFAANSFTSSEFIGVGDANSLKPDFSANGAPLQLGFMVDHGPGVSPRNFELAVDNWSMAITSVPEPTTGALLLFALGVFTQTRSRRRMVTAKDYRG